MGHDNVLTHRAAGAVLSRISRSELACGAAFGVEPRPPGGPPSRCGARLIVASRGALDITPAEKGCAPGLTRRLIRMHEVLKPTQDSAWVFSHEGYNVLTESAVESRLAFGNGFLGMRAARSVSRGPTWVAWLGHCRLSLIHI